MIAVMKTRTLGKTGLDLSILSFGASSIGAEFRAIDIAESLRCVHVALERGMNYIDTAAYYGRGMSEIMLGRILPEIPRESYVLSTKLGRYAPAHFDYSAKRVAESIDISLERMRVDYVDIVFCHDIEFVPLDQIVHETIPALRKQVAAGKVKFIGVSGYPMKMFRYMLDHADLDVILTYNHYTLQNDAALQLVPICKEKGVGIINAAPFSARLLSDATLPPWHKSTPEVRAIAAQAAAHCRNQGSDIAKLALQFSVASEEFASCVTGSASPDRISQWCDWIDEPIDTKLLAEVKEILRPIHNWAYPEGLPENDDAPVTIGSTLSKS
jgi:L-galactose dehydrogenase